MRENANLPGKGISAVERATFHHGFSGLAAAGLATKLLGYVRDALLVAIFGGGMLADAYYAAFRLVNVFRRTVGEGGLNAVFIPLLEKEKAKGPEQARAFFANAWTAIIFGSALLCAAGIIFSRQLAALAAMGFKGMPGQLELTALLAAALMPHLLFVNAAALFTAALNSARRFFLPALAPAIFSITVIGVLLALHAGLFPALGERGAILLVAAAASASGLAQALVLLPALKKEGFGLSFSNPLKTLGAAPMLAAAAPAAVTLAQDQLSLLINTAFASFLAPGSITAIYNSARLVQFPISLFAVSAAVLALPELAERSAAGDKTGFNRRLAPALTASWLIMLPAALGLAATALPLCRALFQHGNFLPAQSEATAKALLWLALGLPAYGINKIAASALYALDRQKEPITVTAAQLILNAALCLPLMRGMGAGGLMLATALSSWAAAITFLLLLRKGSGFTPLAMPLLRPALAAAACGLTALALRALLAPAGPLAVTVVAVPAAVAVYFLLLKLMKVEERALITGGRF